LRVPVDRSWISFQWALPGVVVGIIMPFSVSVRNALKFFVSDVVVSVGVWDMSVDSFLTRYEVGWLVHEDSTGC